MAQDSENFVLFIEKEVNVIENDNGHRQLHQRRTSELCTPVQNFQILTRQRFATEMWMSTILSCSACVKATYLTDGNFNLPEEQSHSSCCKSLYAFRHYDSVVTQARVSLELSMCSRYPGGQSQGVRLHRSQSCHSIFPVHLHRVEFKFGEKSTNHHLLIARPGESFVCPHSNESSVTVYLTSITFCAK